MSGFTQLDTQGKDDESFDSDATSHLLRWSGFLWCRLISFSLSLHCSCYARHVSLIALSECSGRSLWLSSSGCFWVWPWACAPPSQQCPRAGITHLVLQWPGWALSPVLPPPTRRGPADVRGGSGPAGLSGQGAHTAEGTAGHQYANSGLIPSHHVGLAAASTGSCPWDVPCQCPSSALQNRMLHCHWLTGTTAAPFLTLLLSSEDLVILSRQSEMPPLAAISPGTPSLFLLCWCCWLRVQGLLKFP